MKAGIILEQNNKSRESKKKAKYKEICNEGKIVNVRNNTIIPKNHKIFRKA